MQRDPLGFVDGPNLREYVGSSPLRWIDLLGLSGGFAFGGAIYPAPRTCMDCHGTVEGQDGKLGLGAQYGDTDATIAANKLVVGTALAVGGVVAGTAGEVVETAVALGSGDVGGAVAAAGGALLGPIDEGIALTRLARGVFGEAAEAAGKKGAKEACDATPKYHPRIRERALQDPKAHNFPNSFDDAILEQSPITQADGTLLHRLEGSLNGKDGFFEMAINPETNTIFHRTFVGK